MLEEFSHGFTLILTKMNAINVISSTIGLFLRLEIYGHQYCCTIVESFKFWFSLFINYWRGEGMIFLLSMATTCHQLVF
jgi:hypothetical protein